MSKAGQSVMPASVQHYLYYRAIRLLPVALAVFLAACAGTQSAPVKSPAQTPGESAGEGSEEVQQRVREPARQQSAGVQVYSLQNPAVKSLVAEAETAEQQGNFDKAASSLERAIRIQPNDPQVLQSMAEIQVSRKDYQQAMFFATRSYDSGPRVGEICARNWHTISVARGHLGDNSGAEQADQRAGQCMNAKPQAY